MPFLAFLPITIHEHVYFFILGGIDLKEKLKTLLVGVNLKNEKEFQDSMDELNNLVVGLNYEVVDVVTQNLTRFNPRTYVGSGKVDELKPIIAHEDIDCIIVNDELSPQQSRHLEKALATIVIDRTAIILEIFEKRAKSKEAKMQVELAKLEYMLPRLVNQNHSFGQQRGGAFYNKGAGEKKLELERRVIEQRISLLKKELDSFVLTRKTNRQLRQKNKMPIVSLVGYTNAGKSTLMNAVLRLSTQDTIKEVFEKDELFATLDTSVRAINTKSHKNFLLTDTVGFISKLPHQLIKAFRGTLEEVIQSDLLIYVVDVSHPYCDKHIQVTKETIKQLGASEIPHIIVYNKVDVNVDRIGESKDGSIYLSAKEMMNIDVLIESISAHLYPDDQKCEMFIPYTDGGLISFLKEHTHVLKLTYEYEGMRVLLEGKEAIMNKYKQYLVK